MAYIATKPCSFAGKRYRIGEPIPDGAVLPTAIKRLIQAGVIAESEAGFLLPASDSLEKENTQAKQLFAEDKGTGKEAYLDPEWLKEMDYNSLKKLAKDMGLTATGTKEELIKRIAAEGVIAEGE